MSSYRISWHDLLLEEIEDSMIVSCVPPIDSPEMNRKFDPGYGSEEGCPFTCWTKFRVYFPACYDGAEWVESVSRDPNGEVTGRHVGGG